MCIEKKCMAISKRTHTRSLCFYMVYQKGFKGCLKCDFINFVTFGGLRFHMSRENRDLGGLFSRGPVMLNLSRQNESPHL